MTDICYLAYRYSNNGNFYGVIDFNVQATTPNIKAHKYVICEYNISVTCAFCVILDLHLEKVQRHSQK